MAAASRMFWKKKGSANQGLDLFRQSLLFVRFHPLMGNPRELLLSRVRDPPSGPLVLQYPGTSATPSADRFTARPMTLPERPTRPDFIEPTPPISQSARSTLRQSIFERMSAALFYHHLLDRQMQGDHLLFQRALEAGPMAILRHRGQEPRSQYENADIEAGDGINVPEQGWWDIQDGTGTASTTSGQIDQAISGPDERPTTELIMMDSGTQTMTVEDDGNILSLIMGGRSTSDDLQTAEMSETR